uniref:Uncharacterized protein n=1 Tax=Photinus pyralis TaxID=7054 RepID=A0A1Y1N841_PHOPY
MRSVIDRVTDSVMWVTAKLTVCVKCGDDDSISTHSARVAIGLMSSLKVDDSKRSSSLLISQCSFPQMIVTTFSRRTASVTSRAVTCGSNAEESTSISQLLFQIEQNGGFCFKIGGIREAKIYHRLKWHIQGERPVLKALQM